MSIRLDLHTHSRFSFDGFSEPSAMIEMAKARGLHGLAITDHDTSRCVDWFERIGALSRNGLPIEGFLVIPGQEISTAEGHLLALGVRLPDLRGIPAREAVDWVQKLGGVAIAAHPLDRFRHGIPLSVLDTLPLDGIETFNAACTFPQHNAWAAAYAASRGLAGTGGSDAHFSDVVGTAWTEAEVEELTLGNALEAIRAGKVTAHGSLCTRRQRGRKFLSWFARKSKSATDSSTTVMEEAA